MKIIGGKKEIKAMSNIAIITARGGSKRIPHKNIKLFCGKPIIAYSIISAIESQLFDEVMVSTDDQEIAEISKQYGAKVPFFRSSENSNDFATTMDVLTEVLDCYKSRGKKFDYLCCIYPTAPFVTAKKLKNGFDTLITTGTDLVIPVVKFGYPPQRGFTIGEDGLAEYCYPQYKNTRSQDLEPIYHDIGQFYWYNTEKCFSTNKENFDMGTIIVSETEVQDIDNESDWIIAEMKYKIARGEKEND